MAFLTFLKIILSYSYLNYPSPFCQFYTDLKILQNGPLLIKGYSLCKKFHSHVYAVDTTKDFEPFLAILSSIAPSNSA